MRNAIAFLMLLLWIAGCANVEKPLPLFTFADLREIPGADLDNGYPPPMTACKALEVAPGMVLPAVLKVTGRRNGSLAIADINPRVLDGDDDTEEYVGELLSIYLTDLDGDGFRDLILCGVKEIHAEKVDGVIGYRPELMVWRFDPQRRTFQGPFGIFDPYSTVRDYYGEIPVPENRVVLSEKYRDNLTETRDTAYLHPSNFGQPFKITYGLRKNDSVTMAILLSINGRSF